MFAKAAPPSLSPTCRTAMRSPSKRSSSRHSAASLAACSKQGAPHPASLGKTAAPTRTRQPATKAFIIASQRHQKARRTLRQGYQNQRQHCKYGRAANIVLIQTIRVSLGGKRRSCSKYGKADWGQRQRSRRPGRPVMGAQAIVMTVRALDRRCDVTRVGLLLDQII